MRDGEIKQMIHICPECGSEIPGESEFCYSCGRKKDDTIRIDSSGNFIPPEEDKCASCGAEMSQGDLFCPNCGTQRSKAQMVAFRPKMVKYGWIGLMLALIPGTLGFIPWLPGIVPCVFGLGHLYFKRWRKGAVFLFITVFLLYWENWGYWSTVDSIWADIFLVILTLFFYLIQAMEAFVLAFVPPKAPE